MKSFFKRIYTKEYLLFLAIGFLPLIYKVFQISFLNSFENAIKILGQMAFLEIIFKIFQETIINPLFKILGKNDNCDESKNFYAKRLLLAYSVACILFTICIFLLTTPIMKISQVPDEIFNQTKIFLQIMTFVNGTNIIVQYLFTFNIISKDTKNLFIYFLISSLSTLVLGVILIPKFTAGLGIIGLSTSMLIVSVAQLTYFLFKMPKTTKTIDQKFDTKGYAKLCLLSFVETLTRNLTYYFVILVLLNTINNQDLYFITNDFIWSIMLIPTLAQNTCIKQNLSENNSHGLKDYFLNDIVIILFMLLMIPVAFILFKFVFRFENYQEYFLTLLKLVPCYLIFIFDNTIESYFIATGKLHHVFIQTFLTNILVYLTSFILYSSNIWHPTLNDIIMVFSIGMTISNIYTISVYLIENHRLKKIALSPKEQNE